VVAARRCRIDRSAKRYERSGREWQEMSGPQRMKDEDSRPNGRNWQAGGTGRGADGVARLRRNARHGVLWRAGRVSKRPVSRLHENAPSALRALHHREAHASRSPARSIIGKPVNDPAEAVPLEKNPKIPPPRAKKPCWRPSWVGARCLFYCKAG
jgi:hypothetical protein